MPSLMHALGHHRHILPSTVGPRFLRRLCVMVHMDILAPSVRWALEVALLVTESKHPVYVQPVLLTRPRREIVRQVLPAVHTLLQCQLSAMFVVQLVIVQEPALRGVLPAGLEIKTRLHPCWS